MTYKELYEKLEEFAFDKVYQNDEVDIEINFRDYAGQDRLTVSGVNEDGYLIIGEKR